MIRIIQIVNCLFLLLFPNCLFAANINAFHEDSKIEKEINKIRYYDIKCANGPQRKEYHVVYNYGVQAIPSLLKKMLIDEIHSNVGPNGYIFVSACLIERITNDITPLDWNKINKVQLDPQIIMTLGLKYYYFEAIINEMKDKKILDCSLNDNMSVECKKM